jgi:hypothetical protein
MCWIRRYPRSARKEESESRLIAIAARIADRHGFTTLSESLAPGEGVESGCGGSGGRR